MTPHDSGLLPVPVADLPPPFLPEGDRLGQVESLLRSLLTDLTPAPAGRPTRERGRPRVLPATALWTGLLLCVLRGWNSQLDLWRLLASQGLWDYPRFPISDQAVYHRLERDGTAPLQQAFTQLSAALRERLAPWADRTLAPFATEVVALDQMKLDQTARLLPALRDVPAGDDRLLPGAIGALFDLRRQQWHTVEYHDDPHQNEKVAARSLVATLPPGSLVLADLGYFGFAWFDWLADHQYWWVSRQRAKTSYRLLHVFYQADGVLDALVFLGAYRADQAARAVRLVEFTVDGVTRRYVTNVLDPTMLPVAEIARLYARRWDIELAFNLVKTNLGLHILWSAKDVVVQQQVWAVLTISQVLQALRLEIAGRAGVDIFEVSMSLMVKYLPRYAAAGVDPVAAFVAEGRTLRFIRPSGRTRIKAPEVPVDRLRPLPAGLALERQPRYAGRKTGPRSTSPPPKTDVPQHHPS